MLDGCNDGGWIMVINTQSLLFWSGLISSDLVWVRSIQVQAKALSLAASSQLPHAFVPGWEFLAPWRPHCQEKSGAREEVVLLRWIIQGWHQKPAFLLYERTLQPSHYKKLECWIVALTKITNNFHTFLAIPLMIQRCFCCCVCYLQILHRTLHFWAKAN